MVIGWLEDVEIFGFDIAVVMLFIGQWEDKSD
jgi:hypothetical protein